VLVLTHNVVPHETHPGGEWLMTRLLSAADTVLVHSARMAQQAREHGARQVVTVDLPPHLPGGAPHHAPRNGRRGARLAVLALGLVRDYKGVDLLLQAAVRVPDVVVRVAGEQWGRAGERVRAAAADPALAGRVELQVGYVPAAQIPVLLDEADVLALVYRHATASQNVLLAHAYGLPVLASAVGTFPDQVRDGVDGLLVTPGEVDAIEAALRRLCEPGVLEHLQDGVPPVDLDGPWEAYVTTLLAGARV
jgi:glycosyltransferase involved in cell wall biosynthesis